MYQAPLRMLRLAVLAVLAGSCLTLGVETAAAEGELTFESCLANTASDGCLDLPFTPLRGAIGVALSADGRSAYVVSSDAESIAQFRRGANGQLAYDGCLANTAADGCFDLSESPLRAPEDVVVSPDGASVYVTSRMNDSISQFVRDVDGKLTYDGCLADEAVDGCFNLPESPLDSARGLAVSPSGNSVYVTAGENDSIAQFTRGAGGRLTYDGCLADKAVDGCVELQFDPLDGAGGVAVSPDGTSVYVVGGISDAIAHFTRLPGGQLTYGGCLANDASNGCVDLTNAVLDRPRDVTVAPDGKSVYVTANGNSSLVHFTRLPEGQLAYGSCWADSTANACLDVPGFANAQSVALSPDGKSVYVSTLAGTLIHFVRSDAGATHVFEGCLADTAIPGCSDLPGSPIRAAYDVQVSADGRSAYVAAYGSNSVSHFLRAVPQPPTPPVPPPVPTPVPRPQPSLDAAAPQTEIVRGPPKTTARRVAKFRFTADEAGARFQCRLDRQRRWKACASPHTLKGLRSGRHTLRVRGTDSSGNVDPTPAKRSWRVVADI